jgi:two-component system KDP operon response regulator KdpE
MTESNTRQGLRILIVDDEKSIRKFLSVSLLSYAYNISEAATGHQAIDALHAFKPDVVILDLGLPDIDGVEVIKKIRRFSRVPVIILSVRSGQDDKIQALDEGADDYLTKPFGVEELHSRLKAVLRRALKVEQGPVFKTGELSVDFAKRLVKIGDKEIDLTPTEYEILKLLVLSAGSVLTHKHIIKSVWNKDPSKYEGADHLLRVTISNLRNKLEPDPSRPAYIITEPAIGYRLKQF